MRIDVITLFPELFAPFLSAGLLGKAVASGRIAVETHNPRDFTSDRHRTVDDAPYGGGAGMVMKCEPLWAAAQAAQAGNPQGRMVLLSPRGRVLTQGCVKELSQASGLILICGRYEGVDERLAEALGAKEISIGDYVLSGGELPAMVVIEAVSRMLPGVVGDWESVATDSFFDGLLGPPQYTRPPVFEGREVPEVLRHGNHAAIARWRRKEALRVTRARRPELLVNLSTLDKQLLAELDAEEAAAGGVEKRS
jgi:tRNA (guanine37-N1)-methyltransferase